MTFQFRTIYTYCGAIPEYAGFWKLKTKGEHLLTFEKVGVGWELRLTPETAAKVMREPT